MRLETSRFLAKAERLLGEARSMLEIELHDAAGRAAYLAAFHAAQALIFECSGRIVKTHGGVHAEFQRVTRGGSMNPELRAFLSRAYNLKSIADYETGPTDVVFADRAAEAVSTAQSFVRYLMSILDDRTM